MTTDATDSKIYDLLKILETKKTEVRASEESVAQKWVTTGSFAIDNEVPINIQTASEEVLINLVSRLLQTKDYRAKAAELLGVDYDGKIKGYTVEQWVADCKKRIAKIGLTKKQADLAKLEERLNGIVSPEQRRAMELEAITKELL